MRPDDSVRSPALHCGPAFAPASNRASSPAASCGGEFKWFDEHAAADHTRLHAASSECVRVECTMEPPPCSNGLRPAIRMPSLECQWTENAPFISNLGSDAPSYRRSTADTCARLW